MKYQDKIIQVEGIITEVHDVGISIDLKGRLGVLKVPMRMVISDYPLKVGQTVAWQMSFIEQVGPEVNEKYVSNLDVLKRRQNEWLKKQNNAEED